MLKLAKLKFVCLSVLFQLGHSVFIFTLHYSLYFYTISCFFFIRHHSLHVLSPNLYRLLVFINIFFFFYFWFIFLYNLREFSLSLTLIYFYWFTLHTYILHCVSIMTVKLLVLNIFRTVSFITILHLFRMDVDLQWLLIMDTL